MAASAPMPVPHAAIRWTDRISAGIRFTIPIPFIIDDGFVKSDLLRWRTIFAESNSEKRPHCHFERQREIFNNQDSSSLSFLAMTAAEASKIILNIVEFLGSSLCRRPFPMILQLREIQHQADRLAFHSAYYTGIAPHLFPVPLFFTVQKRRNSSPAMHTTLIVNDPAHAPLIDKRPVNDDVDGLPVDTAR